MVARKDKEKTLPAEKEEATKGEITTARPYDIWSNMDKLFDNFRSAFDDLFWMPRGRAMAPLTQFAAPPMDIVDNGDSYEMKINAPGISKDQVNIEVTATGIEVKANQEGVTEETGKNWLRRERSSRNLYRSVEFPEEIDPNNVDAEMKDGVLNITLPKIEPKPEMRPRQVKIK
jgi:HSP20 family protein